MTEVRAHHAFAGHKHHRNLPSLPTLVWVKPSNASHKVVESTQGTAVFAAARLRALLEFLTMAIFGRTSGVMNSFRGGDDRPPFEGVYIYILLFLVGYIIADLSLLQVRSAMLPTEPPPAYSPVQHDVRVAARPEYNIVTDRNLFNADGMIPPALSAQEKGDLADETAPAVLSQLPLKLEGTIVHLNPNRSVATIIVQSKNETQAFMLEDEIEGLAKITRIERRKVTFRNLNNNRMEYIEIPADSAITMRLRGQETAGADTGVMREGEFDFSVRREDLNKYTSDLASILNQARMVPNIVPGSGGRVEGFRFISIQQGSIYEKLGFKSNDVIKSVNGEPVNSPTKAMELYNALRTDSRIKLTVERDGREENFTYDVKD
jgi:general secretion pathway protein C